MFVFSVSSEQRFVVINLSTFMQIFVVVRTKPCELDLLIAAVRTSQYAVLRNCKFALQHLKSLKPH